MSLGSTATSILQHFLLKGTVEQFKCFTYNIIPFCKCQKIEKSACFKWLYGLLGNNYRVATLPKSYLTVVGIIMQSLNSIGQLWCVYINEKT